MLTEIVNSNESHPPLYYLWTQLLYKLLGNHGFVFHLTAVIPYGMILILACVYIRRKMGFVTAIVLMSLTTFLRMPINYNVEARMYALASLFVLISFLAEYELIISNGKRKKRLDNFLSFFYCSGLYTLLCISMRGIFLYYIISSG